MSKNLTIREKRFVKGIVEKNLTPPQSLRMAGYSTNGRNVEVYPYQLLKREKIVKALEEYGLNDRYIVKKLKKNTRVSKGQEVSVSDSNKAIELALRLKGYLDSDRVENNSNNTTNVYIKEIKQLNNNQLLERIDNITKEIDNIKE